MPNTGFKLTGTGAQIAGLNADWQAPTNIQTQNSSVATVTLGVGATASDNLRATNYDFASLVSRDTIIGVSVLVALELTTGSRNDATLGTIQLWDGSATFGDAFDANFAVPEAYTVALFEYSGTMPTFTEATDSGFGVQIKANRASGDPVIAIYFVQIAIKVANTTTRQQARRRSIIRSR